METYENDNLAYIVTEYCSGGSLIERICQLKKFDETQASLYIRQIVMALSHCHNAGICHRDIKPDNLIFANKESDTLKLIDFNLSEKLENINQKMSSIKGTSYYFAPETLMGNYDA
jgi:calcium-dependent protein kinase